MKNLPIGIKLTAWYIGILTLSLVLFGVGIWVAARRSVYHVAQDALEGRVKGVERFLRAQPRSFGLQKLQEEVTEAYVVSNEGDYLQVSDAEGNWLYRAASLNDEILPRVAPESAPHKGIYQEKQIGGKSFLFICRAVEIDGRKYTVQAGLPVYQLLGTLDRLAWELRFLIPVLLMAASAGGYWISRKALAPVDAITNTARSIGGHNLSARLQTLHTGDELQRLSETLNQMLDRVESAFQRVTEFTADASHELRSPVSLIRTEAELALRRSRSPSEYRDALRHILLEAERTTTLVEELLFLARSDSGQQMLNYRPVDVHEVVSSIAEAWHQIAEIRELEFQVAVSGTNFSVTGDEIALRRVLNILLDNACKYTPSLGRVCLTLDQAADTVVFAVMDTGPGISEEDQAKIFERFYRVDKIRSRELGGAGLGLSIAKSIVAQHRGKITVRSKLGEGSTFLVELPLANRSADCAEKPSLSNRSAS